MERAAAREWLAAVMVTALALTACARVTGSGSGSGRITHPSGEGGLVLRIETLGGLVPPDLRLTAIPVMSLYGDGRLLTAGPQIEIYPPPALPNLVQRKLTEAGVQYVLAAAREAGLLGPDRTYRRASVADAATTRFTLVAGGLIHVTSVYALGFEADGGNAGASREESAARLALAEFQRRMGDLDRWLPEGSVGREEPFAPRGLRVFVGPAPEPAPGGLEQPTLSWPLEESLGGVGDPVKGMEGYRCVWITGRDLEQLLPIARRANQLTPWRSSDALFSLAFRPGLPEETGCGPAGIL